MHSLYSDEWENIRGYLSDECEGGYPTFINTLHHEFCIDPQCECLCHDLDIDTREADVEDDDLPPIDYDD